jgi:uncharacterized membrane protein
MARLLILFTIVVIVLFFFALFWLVKASREKTLQRAQWRYTISHEKGGGAKVLILRPGHSNSQVFRQVEPIQDPVEFDVKLQDAVLDAQERTLSLNRLLREEQEFQTSKRI